MWETPAYRRRSPPAEGQQATSSISNPLPADQAATFSSDSRGSAAVSNPSFTGSPPRSGVADSLAQNARRSHTALASIVSQEARVSPGSRNGILPAAMSWARPSTEQFDGSRASA